MPGVIAAMKKIPGENSDQFAARIGAFGVNLEGAETAIFSPTRAITTAVHEMFTKEGRAVWKNASEQGFMDQQVAEIFRTLTAPAEGYRTGLLQINVELGAKLN